MKFNVWTLLAIVVIGVLAIQMLGVYDFTALFPAVPPVGPTPTPVPTGGVVPSTHTANAKWQISDALTKVATASGDTGYVCIVKADSGGYFDLLNPVEETELDASPDTSSGVYSSGDQLLIAVSSDNDPTTGDETYPRWFVIQDLRDGAAIKALPLTNPISALTEYKSGNAYKYKVNFNLLENTNQNVMWLEGATPYWVFGDAFYVYGRADNAGLVESITNKGTIGTSVSDGSSWDDSISEINANFTFTADTEDLNFELTSTSADVAWGLDCLAVSAQGQAQQYGAVLVFGCSGKTLSSAGPITDGWEPFEMMGNTGNVTYYYPFDAVNEGGVPSTGQTINVKIPISISDSGLSGATMYSYSGWFIDWQNLENVARGSFSTSLPTAYGFLTEYGSDTVIQACVPTVTSSLLETPQLWGMFTTNS